MLLSLALDRSPTTATTVTDLEHEPAWDTSTAISQTGVDQWPRCRFLELPPEIRIAIYELLLISPDSSIEAHKLLDAVGPIDPADQHPRVEGIDSQILRTCSKVLYEAAPILYGKNTFRFSGKEDMDKFQGEKDSLFSRASAQFFKTCSPPGTRRRHGRLHMLHKVELRLDQLSFRLSPHRSENPKKVRDRIWDEWKSFFDPDDYRNLSFPSLNALTLDFTSWRLTDNDKMLVRSLIIPTVTL